MCGGGWGDVSALIDASRMLRARTARSQTTKTPLVSGGPAVTLDGVIYLSMHSNYLGSKQLSLTTPSYNVHMKSKQAFWNKLLQFLFSSLLSAAVKTCFNKARSFEMGVSRLPRGLFVECLHLDC